jgi:transposase InsO family protein
LIHREESFHITVTAKRQNCNKNVCWNCFTRIGVNYDASVLGLAMVDNMRAELCVQTVENAVKAYPGIKGAILHSDRGSQYTSEKYRLAIAESGLVQSMNSTGGRCHDNARCESFWARMKEELFYSRNRKSENYTIEELKTMIWRYFMSYWNNRRNARQTTDYPLRKNADGIMKHKNQRRKKIGAYWNNLHSATLHEDLFQYTHFYPQNFLSEMCQVILTISFFVFPFTSERRIIYYLDSH